MNYLVELEIERNKKMLKFWENVNDGSGDYIKGYINGLEKAMRLMEIKVPTYKQLMKKSNGGK